MLKNYLKIALRSLMRSKVHSSINIIGLSMGIACCILIVLFVKDEWTFDAFHSKADRIYRVWATEDWGENQVFFYTVTPFPMGPALKENFEEVVAEVRFNPIGTQIKVDDHTYADPAVIVGKDFFEVFDFKVLQGDATLALKNQNDVVITKQMASKYFGKDDALNKVISMQLDESFEDFFVKAVIDNVPTNSSLRFDILISDLNLPKIVSERTLTSGWFNISPETYVLLKEGADKEQLEKKFATLFKTALGDDFEKSKYTAGLQPLKSIHLDTSFPAGVAPVNDPKYAYILAATSLVILFVACINFVTLSIGRSLKRAKEVGIRKVVGAARAQLIAQFVGEAVIITIIALCFGVILATLNLPLFNTLSGKDLTFEINSFTVVVSLSLVIIIGLFAGSYPAFVLSGFRPASILKGSVHGVGNKQGLRKILVGVQLALSIFLISSTLIMQDQLRYLQHKNLGFNKEQLAVIQLNVSQRGGLAERVKAGFEKVEQFKNELNKIPDIAGVCGSSHDFANGTWTNAGYTDDKGVYRTFNMNTVEPDYLQVLQMEFSFGRNFDVTNPSDSRRAVIVNEAFVKELGWQEPVGQKIPGKNFPDHEVIGVVKDFNYASLYTRVEPLALVLDPLIILQGIENININNSPIPKLLIRLRAGNMDATIEKIKHVWNTLTNGEEFTFTFVDQALAAQYRNDQNLGRIIRIATMLAIVIGSMGLYGLASLAMQNRTKEISIRKVFGATERSLLLLLSKDYVYMIGIALALSVPVTWYLMSNWLASFEYRVNIGPDVFLLSGGIALLIALSTISYQAIKTALEKPAETLKYE